MAQIIYTIVQRVIAKWSHKCISNVDELVGIHAHVEELEKLLNIGLDDVKFIGICGIGGIGKTTIASVVYHRIFHLFEAYCFLDNISEYTHASDLICLQKQLLCATKDPKVLKIESVYEGTWLISTRLRHRRTLLVLDDVDHFTKIQMLARSPDWFGAGSRIIITTRDEHVLRSCGVNEIHKVGQLKEDEALQLFCRNAFKCDHPLRGYEEFTSGALEYAKGHPLAIKSLGSLLLNRSVCEWKSAEAKSQAICQLSMGEVLRKSFVQLRNLEKEIFLDIACFFVGEKINYVKEILNHCRSHSYFGIKSLIGKSLITISNERIQMHDMLKELGWEFVWKESPKSPGGRSRLWLYEDFCLVMNNSIEAKSVKGIVLNQEDPTEVPLMAEAFSKMTNLRLLIIRNVKFSGRLIYLSNQLRYLSWHKYPFTYLPLNFEPHKLVEVVLHKSRITQLWKGVKTLTNLTRMDLRGSGNLVKMPDFKGVPNLERLDLGGCSGLLQLHPSIAALPKLSFLNLKSCTSLISIPNSLFGLSSLEILNLAGCLELAECLDFDDLTRSIKVKELSNQDLPLLEEIGKPSNSDHGYDHENVEPCVNLYEECRDDVAKKTIECFPHGEKLAIQVSNYNSKNKAYSFQMGDAFQEMTEYPKAVDLVKAETYRAMSIESTSSKITPVQYTIAKCIDALDDIDGIPNDKYVKALEKFKDPDWREIFLSMSHSRKKAWLDSLV